MEDREEEEDEEVKGKTSKRGYVKRLKTKKQENSIREEKENKRVKAEYWKVNGQGRNKGKKLTESKRKYK